MFYFHFVNVFSKKFFIKFIVLLKLKDFSLSLKPVLKIILIIKIMLFQFKKVFKKLLVFAFHTVIETYKSSSG